MKIYQKYIIINYLKNFIVILFALELFYVGIDLLTNYQKLPKSANLDILYILFQGINAINYTLPLSVVFAMIVTTSSMIKSNELISIYTLGISRQSLSKPMFITSLFITIIYIFLNFTPFSYADEYSYNLLRFKQILTNTKDVFLKNGEDYIYFGKLDPIKKEATNIRIFKVKNGDITSIIDAKIGYYKGKNWILYDVLKTTKPKVSALGDNGLVIKKFSTLETLKNFRPKIIDNIYKGEFNLSILDAMDALKFYNIQGLDTSRIKTIIFSQLFLPLFAPLLILIFSSKVPIISRYSNLTLISFSLAFIAIVTWGILFLLVKLAINSVVIPEVAIMLPIFILGVISFSFYIKK